LVIQHRDVSKTIEKYESRIKTEFHHWRRNRAIIMLLLLSCYYYCKIWSSKSPSAQEFNWWGSKNKP